MFKKEINKQAKKIFRKLKPDDIKILNIFFRDRVAYVDKIKNELGEKDYSTYHRRIRNLWKQSFLKSEGKDRVKGQPRFYSLTFKGLLALLCDENISISHVIEAAKQVFHEESEGYLSILSNVLDQQTLSRVWNSSFQYWMKTQAKSKVDLSNVKNFNIIQSFTQNMLVGIPEVFRALNPTAISKVVELYKKLSFSPFDKYPVGHCELTLKLNLPIIDFGKIEKIFAENLYRNNWQQAKTILENAVKEKSQITYWLRCTHFIQTPNGERKCAIGEDCAYRNFLLCPKVKESIKSS